MVYDCFSIYNELDLLEIRLNVLWDVVDRFVFTEGTKTHTGKPKPLYFEANKARFAKYASKLVHIVVDDFPAKPDWYDERQVTWMNEDWQRNAVKRALRDAAPDDLIMISDVDEIPSPEAVLKCRTMDGVVGFEQMLTNYYLNFVSYTTPVWRGTKAAKFKVFDDRTTYAKMKPSPYVDEVTNRGATASRLRHVQPGRFLRQAGWHFSYLGGAKAIVAKMNSVAQEYRNENNTSEEWVARVVEQGLDVCGCGRRFFAVPLDRRFPAYLREHADSYRHLILAVDDAYLRRTRVQRLVCGLKGLVREYGRRLIPAGLKPLLFKLYCQLSKEPIIV
ncbi:MAG: hypothetical protein ACI4RD_09860 [Kiritimatiellia bacterium]